MQCLLLVSGLHSRSRNDAFNTPCSTPRKMKRSISTGNISVNTTPVLVLKKGVQDDNGGEELPIVEALRKKNAELELQLSNALETS